jgi:hypothetical protein
VGWRAISKKDRERHTQVYGAFTTLVGVIFGMHDGEAVSIFTVGPWQRPLQTYSC